MSSSEAERPDIPNRRWVARKLRAARMVDWDRFAFSEWGDNQAVTVYGWIDRDDSHEDFVAVIFWPANEDLYFVTSSERYSEDLGEVFFGEVGDHNPCHRVEDAFNVSNAIALNEVSDS